MKNKAKDISVSLPPQDNSSNDPTSQTINTTTNNNSNINNSNNITNNSSNSNNSNNASASSSSSDASSAKLMSGWLVWREMVASDRDLAGSEERARRRDVLMMDFGSIM